MQRFVFLIPALIALTPALAGAQGATTDKTAATVPEIQAQRGETAFRANCSTCHTVKQFTTPLFVSTWNDKPVFELFEQLRVNMPQDNPGKLTRQQYIDVVAYLIKSNGAPSGEQELSPDEEAMKQAKVKMKTGG